MYVCVCVSVCVCVCVYLIISTVFWCSQLNNVFNNRSSELTEEGGGQEGWGSGSGCPECVSDN